MNLKVDIQEDVKRYQDTLNYASSKVDYSIGEHLYMLPSDMELRIRSGTVGYNNKILVSDGKFNLGRNDEVNSLEVQGAPQVKTPAIETNPLETPAIKNHKTNSLETPAIKSHLNTAQGLTHAPPISHEDEKPKITHSDEKVSLVLALAGGFAIWNTFR